MSDRYPLTPEEEAERDAFFEANKDRMAEIAARVQAEQSETKAKSSWKERFGTAGGCLLGLAFTIGPIVIIIGLFKKIDWLIYYGYPFCVWACAVAVLVMLVCLVLAIFRKTRGWAGLGIVLCSYVFGFSTWLWGLIMAFIGAGVVWVIIGLCFYGVGVVVVALIAMAIHGEWGIVGELVLGVVITYAVRALGNFLVNKAEVEQELAYPPLPPETWE